MRKIGGIEKPRGNDMARIKYCHYCAAATTFQGNRCGRCKKANTHKNNNSRWDRVKLKELKEI